MGSVKHTFLLLLFFVLHISSSYSQKNHKWVLSKNKNGIKTYTRVTDKSPIKEVMAVTEIKTSLSSLVALAKDAKNHPNWIYANKYAYFVKEVSDFEWYYYNESNAPWPISNRDIATHTKLSQNPSSYAVRINTLGVPEYVDKKEGIVRIPRFKSSWDFKPVREGVVLVTFKVFVDLGGTLTAWVINFAVDTGPFNTMLGMTKEIQNEKYKNAKLSYIKEKPFNK